MAKTTKSMQKRCRQCNEFFPVHREWQFFCGPVCRDKFNYGKRSECFYCASRGYHRDHVWPHSRSDNDKRNYRLDEYVYACAECNIALSDRTFSQIEDRFLFLINFYQDRLKKMPVQWDDDELDELGYTLRTHVEHKMKQSFEYLKRVQCLNLRRNYMLRNNGRLPK